MSMLYVGATLGPVFQTMKNARKPLEIWMASYMFSRIAEKIVAELKTHGEDIQFYSPYNEGIALPKGAGAYSDHFFFGVKNANETDVCDMLHSAKLKALRELANDMQKVNTIQAEEMDTCIAFLDRYIYLLPVFSQQEDGSSIPMHILTMELDIQEKYAPFISLEELGVKANANRSDYLVKYLRREELVRSNWVKDNKVSSWDFDSMSNGDSEEPKYIAMVQADGDQMGTLLGVLSRTGNQDGIRKVSQFLFKRAASNIEAVKEYGGLPIYFGGDDMLFLAPIYGKNGESVFEFVERLSESFDKDWNEQNINASIGEKKVVPSLSFGIALSYHKYPLQLTREVAAGALFDDAKHAKWNDNRKKKAVCIELSKHSGQMSRLLLSNWKEAKDGEEQISMFGLFVKFVRRKADVQTLRALHWKMMEQWEFMRVLLGIEDESERKGRIRHWFDANFNEWSEQMEDVKQKCDELYELLEEPKTDDSYKNLYYKVLKNWIEIRSLFGERDPETRNAMLKKWLADRLSAQEDPKHLSLKDEYVDEFINYINAIVSSSPENNGNRDYDRIRETIDGSFRIDEFLQNLYKEV